MQKPRQKPPKHRQNQLILRYKVQVGKYNALRKTQSDKYERNEEHGTSTFQEYKMTVNPK